MVWNIFFPSAFLLWIMSSLFRVLPLLVRKVLHPEIIKCVRSILQVYLCVFFNTVVDRTYCYQPRAHNKLFACTVEYVTSEWPPWIIGCASAEDLWYQKWVWPSIDSVDPSHCLFQVCRSLPSRALVSTYIHHLTMFVLLACKYPYLF